MSQPRTKSKRGLREVLEAGVARDELRAASSTGVLFDVCSSNGELFGSAIRLCDGRHVYVEPQQLLGVDVVAPMVVTTHANVQRLAATLTSVLCIELNR